MMFQLNASASFTFDEISMVTIVFLYFLKQVDLVIQQEILRYV